MLSALHPDSRHQNRAPTSQLLCVLTAKSSGCTCPREWLSASGSLPGGRVWDATLFPWEGGQVLFPQVLFLLQSHPWGQAEARLLLKPIPACLVSSLPHVASLSPLPGTPKLAFHKCMHKSACLRLGAL